MSVWGMVWKPSAGVSVLPARDSRTEAVAKALGAFFSGERVDDSDFVICLSEGDVMSVTIADSSFPEAGGGVTQATALREFGIRPEGRSAWADVERSGILWVDQARDRLGDAVTTDALEMIWDVVGCTGVKNVQRVCAPRWLLSLALRLATGERVVVVQPT
jgi:hypothetical protein